MNRTIKTGLLFTISLVLLYSFILLQSCTRPEDQIPPNCDDSPPEYYYLSPGQKAIIPYTGYDTIRMVSNTGDTIRCIGAGKKYFNTEEFEQYSNPACAGHGTEKFYEAYKIEFIDNEKDVRMELAHYFLYFNLPYHYYGRVNLNFKGKDFFIGDSQISRSSVYTYIGSIEIRGKVYSGVNKVQNAVDTSSFMLINKTEGILKFSTNSTGTWELLKE